MNVSHPSDHEGASRRGALKSLACGFGHLAFAAIAAQQSRSESAVRAKLTPLPARAKRVIFLFMQGGPSHVDSFDYKPQLIAEDGRMVNFFDGRTIANSGNVDSTPQRVMQPLWRFRQAGETGRHVSDLFPEIRRHVDDLCLIHSMHTEGIAHGPATLFLHCGSTNFIRPSMGAWISYGLGTENSNLPAFVSISPSSGNGGPRNYGTAFLPPVHQGTAIGRAGQPATAEAIRNLHNKSLSASDREKQYRLMNQLHAAQNTSGRHDAEMEAAIESLELAWRMQQSAPDVLDLAAETQATQQLYGIDDRETAEFGRQCLMARRLAESGVRYIQVTYGDNTANPAWDQHSDLPKHKIHARATDRPVAGLLEDLKQRGLLEDTIVWWGGEFGRTPYAQKNGTGRDHNSAGFTVWLAGGGFRAGQSHGSTDEFGHQAVANTVHMHDLHATILHQLGLNHEQLTYRYDGRDFRLTDVHGRVVHEVLV